MKKCQYCAEEIQDEAIKCKHCGEMLDGSTKAQVVVQPVQTVQSSGSNSLKTLGITIMIFGLFVVFGSYSMDTSVAVPVENIGGISVGGQRVNNLGLMQDRQNYLMGGLVATVAGLLMALLIKGESPAPASTSGPAREPQWIEITVTPEKRAKYATLFGMTGAAIFYVAAALSGFDTGQSLFVGVLGLIGGGSGGYAATPKILADEARNPSGLRKPS